MTIVNSDLQFFYPKVISDTNSNGGRMSKNPIPNSSPENVFNRTPSSERLAGSTKDRKIFCKVNNNGTDPLYDPGVHLENTTPANDRVYFVISTQRGTKGDLTGSEHKYACGVLTANASLSTLLVDVEDAAFNTTVVSGGEIYITDGVDSCYRTVNTVSPSGVHLTITITAPLPKTFAAGSFVAPVYRPTSPLKCSVSNWVETSAAGTYDETTYSLVLNNRSTVEETWTIALTDAQNFTLTGDTLGYIGTGNRNTVFSPNNPDFSLPYFTLAFEGFGGTWANGDTIVFQTHPISVPIFEFRDTPANCDGYSGNFIDISFIGES